MRCFYFTSFFLFFSFSFGQRLHHQTVASIGSITKSDSGLKVAQTIGQQSVVGTIKGSLIVQQGFQQSNWKKITASNKVLVLTTTYPNPYIDVINFQFSQAIGATVFLVVYDVLGRQVFSNTLHILDNKTSVNLQVLPNAAYFVKLSNNGFKYYTQIIKKSE